MAIGRDLAWSRKYRTNSSACWDGNRKLANSGRHVPARMPADARWRNGSGGLFATDERRTYSWWSSHRWRTSAIEIGSKAQGAGAPTSSWPLISAAICRAGIPIGADPRLSALAMFSNRPDTRHDRGERRTRTDTERNRFCGHSALRQRSFPLQTATKTATNGSFLGEPRNAKAHVSKTYDTWAADSSGEGRIRTCGSVTRSRV